MTTERTPRTPRSRDTKPPQTGAEEAEVLVGFLNYLREAVAAKLDGVAEPAVRTSGVPSGTNLLGLVKHLTYVERFVFLGEDTDDWETTFRPLPDESVAQVLDRYRGAIAEANDLIAACDDLAAAVSRLSRPGQGPSMRWALTHIIEETGRHAGHADILREQIDGAAGR